MFQILFTVSKYLIACSHSVSWEETSEMKLILVPIASVVSRSNRDSKLEYCDMGPFPLPLIFFPLHMCFLRRNDVAIFFPKFSNVILS